MSLDENRHVSRRLISIPLVDVAHNACSIVRAAIAAVPTCHRIGDETLGQLLWGSMLIPGLCHQVGDADVAQVIRNPV